MARTKKKPAKKARKQTAKTSAAPKAPRAPRARASGGVDNPKVLGLFTRPEGCSVREYADALGLTRQAATMRLKRFAELGILSMSRTSAPASFEDLAKANADGGRSSAVYRAILGATVTSASPVSKPLAASAPAEESGVPEGAPEPDDGRTDDVDEGSPASVN